MKTRQRRTQLMRNISQEAVARLHQLFQPRRHLVEVGCQIADLIAPPQPVGSQPHLEVARSQAPETGSDPPDWYGEIESQQPAEYQNADQGAQNGVRAHIERQGWRDVTVKTGHAIQQRECVTLLILDGRGIETMNGIGCRRRFAIYAL